MHNRARLAHMFRRRQPLRRWAALALLLWLFGIGASVAHACMAPRLAVQGQPVQLAQAAGEHAACHGEGQALADEPLQARTNCQDFCEKASVSIAPLKAALDQVLGAALLFPVLAAVVPLPAPAPVQHTVPRRDGALAPPVRIAFLRLAL